MHLQRFASSFHASSQLVRAKCPHNQYFRLLRRAYTPSLAEYQSKYKEQLAQKSKETGLPVDELLTKAQAVKEEQRKADVEKLKRTAERLRSDSNLPPTSESVGKEGNAGRKASLPSHSRKDAPPYKELSSILNLQRLLSTPHTAEQISTLWTAYHASRSGGTGRGYVCAAIPLAMYEKMAKNGRGYPSFVVPVPRVQLPEASSESHVEEETAHEFYYLQWDFHPNPPIPSASDDPFLKPVYTTPEGQSNSPTSTVLFAPLQEYKLRQTFATPYLVLTMYADLAATHGIVLLRGEITPSTAAAVGGQGAPDRWMVSQEDAQLLTMALQRFYLWGQDAGGEGKELLKKFHEKPEEFDWKDLLDFSKLPA